MRRWLLVVTLGVWGGGAGCDVPRPPASSPPTEASTPSPEPVPPAQTPSVETPSVETPPAPPAPCAPTTCEAQQRTCGTLADGCGAVLTCGAACADREPGPRVCEGLMPARVAPRSEDILLPDDSDHGCAREPAMDGEGTIAYTAYERMGYHRVAFWSLLGAKGHQRDAFLSNPLPRMWPQARGFQMVHGVLAGADFMGFQVVDGTGTLVTEDGVGEMNNPWRDRVASAPDPAGGTVVAWSQKEKTSIVLKIKRYDGAGQVRLAETTVATWTSSYPPVPIVGTDAKGRTLVLWDGESFFGADSTAGRWLDEQGQPLTGIFMAGIAPRMGSRSESTLAPLIGGGLALQFEGVWSYGFESGDPRALPLPGALSKRQGRLERVRGGKAYALLLPAVTGECGRRVEILAPEGTSCGTLTFGQEECEGQQLVLGAEGSVLQQQRLAHPGADRDGNPQNGCTLKWWPGLLR